jgi:2'-5' RNA ligase
VPRTRLGVALLLPEPLATSVDALRLACDDGAIGRVAPHITLVPPVNVRAEDLGQALRIMRAAAAATKPIVVVLGPPRTFLPTTPTLHLGVEEASASVGSLQTLRDAVFRPPLERSLTNAFVPHVTISDDMEEQRIGASITALAGFVMECSFDRVHLLEEQRHGDAHRRWVPIADFRFSPAMIVGRGGIELELSITRMLDPEARAFEEALTESVDGSIPGEDRPSSAEPVMVTARRSGIVVGVARGHATSHDSELVSVAVAPDQRGLGIGRQLVNAFTHAASSV